MAATPQRYVRIEDDLWNRASVLAEADDRNTSYVIRKALIDYLDRVAPLPGAPTESTVVPRPATRKVTGTKAAGTKAAAAKAATPQQAARAPRRRPAVK